MTVDDAVAAGPFAAWLDDVQAAIRGERAADVPCGACTACCRSSQFVHIGPDETDTLAHVPRALLFPAPRLPRGHVLMGYDERGHCPMLVNDRCTIYEHRPRACRTYDCRVFPAAGLDAADDAKPLVAERARRWRFAHDTPADSARHDAVRAAAAHLGRHPELFPDGAAPLTATQLAVVAIEVHELYLGPPSDETVRVELRRRRPDRP